MRSLFGADLDFPIKKSCRYLVLQSDLLISRFEVTWVCKRSLRSSKEVTLKNLVVDESKLYLDQNHSGFYDSSYSSDSRVHTMSTFQSSSFVRIKSASHGTMESSDRRRGKRVPADAYHVLIGCSLGSIPPINPPPNRQKASTVATPLRSVLQMLGVPSQLWIFIQGTTPSSTRQVWTPGQDDVPDLNDRPSAPLEGKYGKKSNEANHPPNNAMPHFVPSGTAGTAGVATRPRPQKRPEQEVL